MKLPLTVKAIKKHFHKVYVAYFEPKLYVFKVHYHTEIAHVHHK